VQALQAAAFSTTRETEAGHGGLAAGLEMCIVVLNRGVAAVDATLAPSSLAVTNVHAAWKSTTAVALNASKRECDGDGRGCWVPIPDETTPAEQWAGPLVAEKLAIHENGDGASVSVTVPALSVAFVRLLPRDSANGPYRLSC
jgi:hypothetical protein